MSDEDFPADLGPAYEVVAFWKQAGPKKWFAKSAAFDDEFRSRFMALHFAAARRELEPWCDTPESGLALIILLDQFPRNAFRDTAHMFATDPLARLYARRCLQEGLVRRLEPALQLFAILPFMHSEDLADQELCVRLHAEYGIQDTKWVVEHRDIIQMFGRFPHRNASLGRQTTAQERAYLDGGGFAG